jgi:hypothetical protein
VLRFCLLIVYCNEGTCVVVLSVHCTGILIQQRILIGVLLSTAGVQLRGVQLRWLGVLCSCIGKLLAIFSPLVQLFTVTAAVVLCMAAHCDRVIVGEGWPWYVREAATSQLQPVTAACGHMSVTVVTTKKQQPKSGSSSSSSRSGQAGKRVRI